MKKRTKILLAILTAVAVAVGITVAVQWNNVKAAYLYFRYSPEDIVSITESSEAMISETLSALPGISVRELTPAEQEKLADGDLSPEAALDAITAPIIEPASDEDAPDAQPVLSQDPGKESSQPAKAPVDIQTYNAELSQLIGRIYVLQATYVGKLEGLRRQAAAEYSALPAKDRTKNAKMTIGKSYLGIAADLEASCDAEMSAITGKIKEILKKSGGDVSLVSKIQKAYENEKACKKAYYLSLYD